jgi:hypothetical protein
MAPPIDRTASSRPRDGRAVDTSRLAAHRATLDRPTTEAVSAGDGKRRGAKARTGKSRRRTGP